MCLEGIKMVYWRRKKENKNLEESERQRGIWISPLKIMKDLWKTERTRRISHYEDTAWSKARNRKVQGPLKNSKPASAESSTGNKAGKTPNATSQGMVKHSLFLQFYFFIVWIFACMYVCSLCMCLAPVVVRESIRSLGRYKQLWTPARVPGIEPKSSARAASTLSLWNISPALYGSFLWTHTKDLCFRKITLAVWTINNHSFSSQKKIKCIKRTKTIKYSLFPGPVQQG